MRRKLLGGMLGTIAFSVIGYANGQRPAAANEPESSAPALSQCVAHDQIEAPLDPVKKTIDATETLTYKNLTGQP